MKFDIHQAAATETIRSTNSSQDSIRGDLAAGSNAASGIVGSLPHSEIVSNAVESLRLEVLEPSGDDVLARISAATSSTSQALGLYGSGDQEMAQQANSNSSAAGVSDIPGVR